MSDEAYDTAAISRKNRAEPLKLFITFLEKFWRDNLEQEAIGLWKNQIHMAPWYAEDVLYALDAVIADPPANLVQLMQEHGWIMLPHDPGASTLVRRYHQQYLAWLQATAENFKRVFEETRPAPSGR